MTTTLTVNRQLYDNRTDICLHARMLSPLLSCLLFVLSSFITIIAFIMFNHWEYQQYNLSTSIITIKIWYMVAEDNGSSDMSITYLKRSRTKAKTVFGSLMSSTPLPQQPNISTQTWKNCHWPLPTWKTSVLGPRRSWNWKPTHPFWETWSMPAAALEVKWIAASTCRHTGSADTGGHRKWHRPFTNMDRVHLRVNGCRMPLMPISCELLPWPKIIVTA